MQMRRLQTTVVLCLGLGVGAGLAGDVAVTVGTDINSAYVWRGATLNEGAVVQPWLDIDLPHGLKLNVWGNLDIEEDANARQAGEFSEVRLRGAYRFALGPLACDAGYIEYLFPVGSATNTPPVGTRELYAAGDLQLGGGLAAWAALYYDFDEAEALYANAGLRYGCSPLNRLNLALSAAVGYVGATAAGQTGPREYTVTLGAFYEAGDAVVLAGSLAYTDSLDEDVLPEPDTHLYGGISLAYAY
jgi:hypothetical protein